MAVFTDLVSIATDSGVISEKTDKLKWTSVPYETKLGKGIGVISAECATPENITLNINLDGWHRIYLCMVEMGQDTYTHIKLTDDLCFSGVKIPPKGNPKVWASYEYLQEFYWKSADLSGQQIILEKPKGKKCNSNLLWIRCEKMDADEIERYNAEPERCIQGHIDVDPFIEEAFENLEDSLIKLHSLKNSNIDFCTVETFVYGDQVNTGRKLYLNSFWPAEWQGNKFEPKDFYKRSIEYGHNCGMKMYAGIRMCAGNFISPIAPEYYNKNFFEENPQLFCENRDGRIVKVCSYAYPETRQYMLDQIRTSLDYGFDGVSLIYIRGMHIGFEQPVLDRFAELYPGVNPKILPFSDARLHGVLCEFMTGFMRDLRKELGADIKINVLTDYGLSTSKHLGLDVEAWADEGLIDSASQCDMETYEDLDGCLLDDGTIDMEKYIKKSHDTEIIKRNFATNLDKILLNIDDYLNLKKYGTDVYNVLPWVHTLELDKYKEYVEKLKAAGAEKFIAWNTNHMVWDCPEYNTMRTINNDGLKLDDFITYYRTLSLFNRDISGFSPCWKG